MVLGFLVFVVFFMLIAGGLAGEIWKWIFGPEGDYHDAYTEEALERQRKAREEAQRYRDSE